MPSLEHNRCMSCLLHLADLNINLVTSGKNTNELETMSESCIGCKWLAFLKSSELMYNKVNQILRWQIHKTFYRLGRKLPTAYWHKVSKGWV